MTRGFLISRYLGKNSYDYYSMKKKKKIENQMNERKIAIDYAKHDFFFLSRFSVFFSNSKERLDIIR